MAAYCAGLVLLAMLAAEDIRERKISVNKLLIFALLAVCYRIFMKELWWQEILGAVSPGIMLLLLSWSTNESIGYGDGMTVVVLGLWMGGWFTLQILGIGILLTGIYAVWRVIRKKRGVIPFVPFLLAGMEVALIYE